jgi:dihydroneopterin aldolase
LQLVGICGALPEERERAQPLEVDLDVEADLSPAGASDELSDTIDYGALCDVVSSVVAGGMPQLLEHLAASIAEALLDADGRISAVEVAVRKLRPPVPHALATSGVRIRRAR